MSLPIHTRYLRLTVTRGGRLLPWLGPALRGTIARQLKDRVCRWPPVQRELQWKFCRGCPHQGNCDYGDTFEPDPPGDRTVLRTINDGQRAITMMPCFPLPAQGKPGDRIPLRLLFLGRRACEASAAVVAAVIEAGQQRCLGSDDVTFSADEQPPLPACSANQSDLGLQDLAASPNPAAGKVPWLRLELASPLFLAEESASGKHRTIVEPSFAHLFRASLRVVGRAFAVFGGGSLDEEVDFAGLKGMAEQVPKVVSFWTTFRQPHHSRRGRQRYELSGISGGAVFANVPVCLLPWLTWGGRLGVGEHRVAGAGTWRLVAE